MNNKLNINRKNLLVKKVLILGTDPSADYNEITIQLQRELSARDLDVGVRKTNDENSGKICNSDIAAVNGEDIIIIEDHWLSSTKIDEKIFSDILQKISPEAIVLTYEPGREVGENRHLLRLHEQVLSSNCSTGMTAICFNSFGLTNEQSISEEKRLEISTGLPIVDFLRVGFCQIADDLIEHFYQPNESEMFAGPKGHYQSELR